MEIMIDEVVDGIHVVLLYQGEEKPVHISTRVVAFDIQRLDDQFPPSKASAFLVSEVGYASACALLGKHGIPLTSRLWDLNHEGPPAHLKGV